MHITDIYIRRMYVYVYTKVLTHISRYSCVCVCVCIRHRYTCINKHTYMYMPRITLVASGQEEEFFFILSSPEPFKYFITMWLHTHSNRE